MSIQLLQGYRALDLTDGEPQVCGRILSDFGADVIRIERPGGDPSRHIGPFFEDKIHPEKSLWWYFLNANKRGITLNLEREDGRQIFKKLVKTADFVIESFRPGHLAKLGLDYPALSKVNPKIILTSITPFGQTGPYQDYKSLELTLMALGIFMYGTGDPDRAPVKPNYPLASVTSGITGFAATMIAHYQALKSGQGQHIDVSAQAAPIWFTGNIGAWWQHAQRTLPRTGPYNARRPDLNIRFFWPCKDGYVAFQLVGGAVGTKSNKAMAKWIIEEGMADDYFQCADWDNLSLYSLSQEEADMLQKSIGPFLLSKTKHELVTEATKRGVLLGYMDNMKELYQNPQLATGFWREIEHPELKKSLTYPGLFMRSSLAECGIRRRAPLIGEHNKEVYGEIGISKEQYLSLNHAGVV